MRKISFLLPLVPLIVLLAPVLAACTQQSSTTNGAASDTIPLIVTKIQACARLYTSEYKVHKIVTHDDQLALKGSFLQQEFNISLPLTQRHVAIPIDATVKAYIDFETFSEHNIQRHEGKIIITLPDPKVVLTDSRIDHDEITRYVSLMRTTFSDAELAIYEEQGRAAILNSVPQMGIIDQARHDAVHALAPLLKQMGYSDDDIIITFRKTFTPVDLPQLIDMIKID